MNGHIRSLGSNTRYPSLVLLIALFALFHPASARAQSAATSDPPSLSIRPVITVNVERFAASSSFDATFGSSIAILFGGGVRVEHGNLFVEATASRFKKDGERGFAAEGEGYGVGIPLTVTITPIEFAVGRKFHRFHPSITPYVGGGIGIYSYKETASEEEDGEDVALRHAGWLIVGGAEFRVHRWITFGADLQYTSVPGILGQGGLSEAVDESNLGGIAARFKVIFGR